MIEPQAILNIHLISAASQGKPRLVRKLLSEGADPQAHESKALLEAILSESLATIKSSCPCPMHAPKTRSRCASPPCLEAPPPSGSSFPTATPMRTIRAPYGSPRTTGTRAASRRFCLSAILWPSEKADKRPPWPPSPRATLS